MLFSLWRVRRAWLRNIVKKCDDMKVRREIFKSLGDIVNSIWKGSDSAVSIEKFMQDFSDQIAFMQYFKDCWLPKIGLIRFFSNGKFDIVITFLNFTLFFFGFGRDVAVNNAECSTCKPGSRWCY